MSRRGFMLLEILLAVTAAVMVAIAGYALLGRVGDRVERASRLLEASDLACSSLALIEAGVSTPENLHGSVHQGAISLEGVEAGAMVRDPEYRLEVVTTPSQWAGLVQVDVSVVPVEGEVAIYTASQLLPSRGVEP